MLLGAVDNQIITKLRKNMHPRLVDPVDRLLLRKRVVIEAIIDQLKNISQIEHTRHRGPQNFLVNLVCGLIAYCHQPEKPSIHWDHYLKLDAASPVPTWCRSCYRVASTE